jgi:hypothetical protein
LPKISLWILTLGWKPGAIIWIPFGDGKGLEIVFSLAAFKVIEEAAGAVFDEVGDEFEAIVSAIVGVGDFAVVMLGAVVGKTMDAAFLFFAFGEGNDVGVVLVVHGEDEIEGFEIVEAELAGVAGDLVIAFPDGVGHTGVRFVAGVVAEGSCGVANDFLGEAGFPDEMAEDVFASRGAADVAHADEEDVGAFHGEELEVR